MRVVPRTPFGAVVCLELRLHAREPLTWLYLLVFSALTTGFVAGDVVALVPSALRGSASAGAPLVIALAMSGLSAFGQVITTMVSATTQLRDRALRVDELVLTTPATTRDLVAARIVAIALVMSAVTLGMPLGAMLGAALSSTSLAAMWSGATAAWLLLVVPSVLLLTGLHAVIAGWRPSLYALLAGSAVLLLLWQATTSVAVVTRLGPWARWADPFGGAPLLAVAAATGVERGSLWNPALLAGRAGMAVAGVVLSLVAVWRAPRRSVAPVRPSRADSPARTPTVATAAPSRHRTTWLRVARASAANLLRTTLRERAFVGLAAVGAINVLLNVWARPDGQTAPAAFLLATEHGRLFLILLATIYAGELLWRPRDLRADALLDATAASPEARALGGIAGLVLAEGLVAMMFTGAALLPLLVRGALHAGDIGPAMRWLVVGGWIPLMVLTMLSLATHVVVRHKVVAHLLLISTWIACVIADAKGIHAPWARLGLDLAHGRAVAGLEALPAHDVLHWVTTGTAAAIIAVVRWPRGASWRSPRWSTGRVALCVVAVTAAVVTGVIVSRGGGTSDRGVVPVGTTPRGEPETA